MVTSGHDQIHLEVKLAKDFLAAAVMGNLISGSADVSTDKRWIKSADAVRM